MTNGDKFLIAIIILAVIFMVVVIVQAIIKYVPINYKEPSGLM